MLSVQTLGKLQIMINGRFITLRMSKAAVLLVYLMRQEGVVHGREQLATLLWPEDIQSKTRENFRQALYQIRRLFSDRQTADHYLIVTRNTVQFCLDTASTLDANLFEKRVVEEEWETALDLYEGEFLATYYPTDAQALGEWQTTTREQLHHLAVHACTQLASQSEKRDPAHAAHFARQLLTLEPWAEEGYRILMRWWAGQGQTATALAEYQKCVVTLSEELGINPAAKTTTLYEQIRDGRFSSLTPLTHNLPAMLTPLVGRQQELTTLQQHLADSNNRLLTLVGSGGVGKTKLMLELGWRVVRNPPTIPFSAIYFISLAELEPDEVASLPEKISSHLLQILDIHAPSPSITFHTHTLAEKWGDRSILLLLDNWEHLMAGTGLLTTWLSAMPHLRIIVTSREPLRLYGETIFSLRGLSNEMLDNQTLDNETSEAGQLFVQRARRVQPHFQWDENTAPFVRCICQAVGGHPLALEMAAAQLRVLTLAEVADGVSEGMDLLKSSHVDVLPRQRDMRQILAQSWDKLPADQQQILAQLALFRQPFAPAEAQAVTGASRTQLALVVAYFWLRRTENGRYQYHELLRHFAHEQLVAQPTLYQQARRAYIQGHFDYLQSRQKLLEENPSSDMFIGLYQRHADLEQAWKWAISEEWLAEIAAVSRSLASFYLGAGFLPGGIRLFEQTIRQLRQFPVTPQRQRTLAHLLLEEAMLRNVQVNCELVPDTMVEVIELAQSLSDETLLIQAYKEYGIAMQNLGQLTEGREHLKTGLALAERHQDWGQVAAIYSALGTIDMDEGLFVTSVAYYDRALEWYEQLDKPVQLNNTRHNLAITLTHLGQYRRARRLYQKNLASWRTLERRMRLAATLEGLGYVALMHNRFRSAQLHLRKALRLYIEMEDLYGMAYAQLYLGHWAVAQGMLSMATTYYRAMIATRQRSGSTHLLNQGWAGLAEVALRREQWHEAMIHVERCWPDILAGQVLGEDPMQIYLTCYAVLTAIGDERASVVLDKALAHLDHLIMALGSDKLGVQMLLEAVPSHRALLTAARQSNGG